MAQVWDRAGGVAVSPTSTLRAQLSFVFTARSKRAGERLAELLAAAGFTGFELWNPFDGGSTPAEPWCLVAAGDAGVDPTWLAAQADAAGVTWCVGGLEDRWA